jgi:hypothetical protein
MLIYPSEPSERMTHLMNDLDMLADLLKLCVIPIWRTVILDRLSVDVRLEHKRSLEH